VVVVGFDRKTIQTPGLGNPLPREQVAKLVSQLKADGARVIAFDVIYSGERSDQVAADAQLAAAITQAGNVVLAVKGNPQQGKGDRPIKLTAPSTFAEGLTAATFDLGHVQVNSDPGDGVKRSIPLVAELPNGEFAPALSLAAVMRYRGESGR